MAEIYARGHDHVFLPRRFENPEDAAAHRLSTGPEIARQLELFGVRPDSLSRVSVQVDQ